LEYAHATVMRTIGSLSFPLLALSLASVGCEGETFVSLASELQAPASFSFGEVGVASDPLIQTNELENSGQRDVRLLEIRLDGEGPFRFSLDGGEFTRSAGPMLVPVGNAVPLAVSFLPTAPGTYEEVLVVETNINQGRTIRIQLSGSATDDVLCASTAPDAECRGDVLVTWVEVDCPGRDEPGWATRLTECPAGCDADRAVCASCGDGILDPGETCDGADLGGATCASEVGGVGALTCRADCTGFDVSACAVCGNDTIEGDEVCDGANTGGATCATELDGQGEIRCQDDCSALDLSACTVCGDGVIEGDEVCDGDELDGRTCFSEMGGQGTLACLDDCSAFDESQCTLCGDGVAEGDENCDGDDFRGQTCPASGELACGNDCQVIDRSGCYACGDGAIEGPEVCDGTNLDGRSCLTETGLAQGTLRCSNDCLMVEAAGCFECGNGQIEGPEICDGTNLAGSTCQSAVNLPDGQLACNANCLGFESSDCHDCGNRVIEGPEVCDVGGAGQPVLGGETCASQSSFDEGNLGCAAGCRAFDVRNCYTCGNATIEGPEVCDGTNLGSPAATCLSETGLGDGALACSGSCLQFDAVDCHDCGNGTLEGPEVCDGTNFGSPPTTCRLETGLRDGTLACTGTCRTLDTSGCYQCGNAVVEGPELCDGADFAGETCASQTSFTSGDLSCGSGCLSIGTAGCFTCGNGSIEGPEVCDGTNFDGATCQTEVSLAEGALDCTSQCQTVDTSGCFECGNGLIEGPEECDGLSLDGETCASQGRPGGNLACDAFCEFDLSLCSECGNGQCEIALGETISNCPSECAWDIVAPTGYSPNVCGIRGDGNLYCGGSNFYGQIGDGSNSTCPFTSMCEVSWPSGAGDPVDFEGSSWHVCATGTSTTSPLHCWGWNAEGQLGDGTTVDRNTPVAVSNASDIDQVSTGYDHSCALLTTGDVECWGSNAQGQLGDGTNVDSTTPVSVSGITTATKVATGYRFSCALLSAGDVECWGDNAYGQLGDGTNTDRSSPVAVSGLTDAVDLSVGEWHACSVRRGGQVECWGYGASGELGNGQTRSRNSPGQVSNISTAVEVELGESVSCARLSSGAVRCWGAGSSGALGNGGTANSSTPVATSITGAQDLRGMYDYRGMCADRGTNGWWCWGRGLNNAAGAPQEWDY
jgi:hypothetical protein